MSEKYLCINCKEEWDEIPSKEKNECDVNNYFSQSHMIIKRSDIIKRVSSEWPEKV